MKIRDLIILSFVITLFVLSIGSGYYNYITSENTLKEEVENHLITAAGLRSEHIETYLTQNLERLKLITSRTRLRNLLYDYNQKPDSDNLKDIIKILRDAKEPIEEFERVCIIDPQGILTVSTDEGFCGKNISDKDFFLKGKIKEDIYFIKDEEGKNHLFVSGPIMLDDKFLGVGLVVINTDFLESIVKSRTGLRDTGEILISIEEETGRLSLFDRLFEQEVSVDIIESPETAEPMKTALKGEERLFEKALDYRNKEVIAVSQFIESGNIGLVAKIDLDETLYDVKKKQATSFLIMIIVEFLFVFVVGFIISDKISQSLSDLTEDVKKITKGDFNVILKESKIDEIKSLSESFKRILASMKLAIFKKSLSGKELGFSEAVKAKEKAEERLKIFKRGFEVSPNSMLLVEYKEGNPIIKKVNKSFTEYYGYPEKEAIGKNPNILKSGKQSKEYYKKMWSSLLDPKIGFWRDKIINQRKDGTPIKVILSISTLFDKDNKPANFIAHHIVIKKKHD